LRGLLLRRGRERRRKEGGPRYKVEGKREGNGGKERKGKERGREERKGKRGGKGGG